MTEIYTYAPGGSEFRSPVCGPKVACLGDSMQDTAFVSIGASNSTTRYRNYAMPTWVRYLTKQRVNLPFEMNFAHSGDTLLQISERVDDCLAAKPDLIIFNGGTNDLAVTTNTYQAMKDTFINLILQPIMARGIPMIITPITPRPVSGISQNQLRYMQQFNNFLRDLCHGGNNSVRLPLSRYPLLDQRTRLLYFADATPYWCNYTNADGDPLSGYLRDTVHASGLGAYWYGKAVADVINTLLPPLGTHIQHPADYYDATRNPTGNILRSGTANYGLLKGTTGTATTSSGFSFDQTDIATGYTMSRTAGSSTMVCTLAKENPRTDGPNSGERQLITLTGANTGLADETYRFRLTSTLTIGGSNDLQTGDIVIGQIGLQVISHTNCIGIELVMSHFTGGVTTGVSDMAVESDSGAYPTGAHEGILRTPPLTLTAGNTSFSFALTAHLKTNVSAGALAIALSDPSLRKVLA